MRLNCKTGILSSVGSSFFSCNSSIVYCTINGPIDSQNYNKECIIEVKWSEGTIINHKRIDRYYSYILTEILSIYIIKEYLPYKTLYIDFHCIGSDNLLFCAVNAALLAILDASVSIKKMFYGLSTFSSKDNLLVYDDSISYRHNLGEVNSDGILKYLDEIKEMIHYESKNKMKNILIKNK